MNTKYIIYIFCILIVFWGCTSNTEKQQAHSHDKEHACDDHDHDNQGQPHDYFVDPHEKPKSAKEAYEDEIVFTKKQAQAVGLELEKVTKGEFHQIIKTSGQILSAQGDETTISAPINGIVSFNKSSLNEGMTVRAGESLLSISTRNISDGDPIRKAKNEYEVAKQEYERAQSLIQDKLISEIDYNRIKLEYDNATASYSSLTRNQSNMGSSVSSRMNGFIKSRLVSEGQYVEMGELLVVVTQNKRLQLYAEVPQRYQSSLSSIISANFKTPYDDKVYKLSELEGKLTSYARSLNKDEFYLPVNFEFNNIGQIVSGAYVEVYLISGKKQNAISVPISSLIEDQGVYFVFVQLDAEGYEKREVELGANDGNRVEILKGLDEGDIVATKSAIHIKLASASSDIPHGHEH